MSKFLKLLGVDVRPYAKKIEGCDYIPWALALALAGRPEHETVVFDTAGGHSSVRPLFGGSAVAVDMDIGNGTQQRVYLPVLDLRGNPIPVGEETGRDVGDTQGRCAARATAIVHGLGLSLYSRTKGDGKAYVEALSVAPNSGDLSKVSELRDLKEIKDKKTGRVLRSQEYLGWHATVAAARITDPEFYWEIVECDVVDRESGEVQKLPAMKLAGQGWMVGVKIHWKGRTHTQWLPIMGIAVVQTKTGPKPMEHQPISEPSIFQWHSAVMRCLAKALAIATGYGITCYAGEHEGLDAEHEDAEVAAQAPAQAVVAKPAPAAVDPVPLVAQVRALIGTSGSDETRFLAWLGVPSLESASPTLLQRGYAALQQRMQPGASEQTHH